MVDIAVPELAVTRDSPRDGNEEAELTYEPFNKPMPSSPVRCSTEHTILKLVHDNTATPSGPTKRKGIINFNVD